MTLMNEAFHKALETPPPCGLNISQIAECYGVSRQSLSDISKRHYLEPDFLAVPEIVFHSLNNFGRASRFRRRLESIEERRRIAAGIAAKQSQTKN